MFLFKTFIQYLTLKLIGKYRKNGFDIFRSTNCFILCLRGIYCILNNNEQSLQFDTCTLINSYLLTDMVYMLINKYNRIDLWLHHIFVFIAYYEQIKFKHKNDIFLSNIFLLAESLSILNVILKKKPTLLKKWRLFCIFFIRIPIWVYYNYYIQNEKMILKTYTSGIISRLGCYIMPLFDIYFIYKIQK